MLNRKSSAAPIIIAGLAAFAWYKYAKMSPEQKQTLTTNLKEKGKKIYDKYVPQSVKDGVTKQEVNPEYADI